MLEIIYNSSAYWGFGLIEALGYEMLLTLIFTVDEDYRIKFTLDFGLSKWKSTLLCVSIILLALLFWYTFTDFIQMGTVTFLAGLKSIYVSLFILFLGLNGLWLSKITFSRKWKNKAVITFTSISIIGVIISLIILNL